MKDGLYDITMAGMAGGDSLGLLKVDSAFV